MTDPASHAHSDVVAQATGMVSVQADCTVDDALLVLLRYASGSDQNVETVAAGVVGRSITFN